MQALNMNASRRIAFPLAVLLHLAIFYVLSKQSIHVTHNQNDRQPLTITLLPFLAQPVTTPKPNLQPPSMPRQESNTAPAHHRVAKQLPATQAITPPAAVSVPSAKPTEPEAPPEQSGALLAQSALNAIGKIDQQERGGAGKGLGMSAESGALGSRLSAAIDKHGAFKAGVIEEHVYPDGRREERIHSIFGDYCITYESAGDPKDGFDTMQRGLRPSVPHTCGHRFD